jgi:hypothetical protein
MFDRVQVWLISSLRRPPQSHAFPQWPRITHTVFPGCTFLRQAHSAYTVRTNILSMRTLSETGTLWRPSMHPPAFCLDHRLSDWPGCFLEIQCCKGVTLLPVRLLLSQHGDRTFKTLIKKLRCDRCGKSPAPIYLYETAGAVVWSESNIVVIRSVVVV